MSSRGARRSRPVDFVVASIALWLAALAALIAVAPAARAGGPGEWTDLSGPVGSLLVQPRVARDAAGMLHVVWITEGATQDLKQRPVAADGAAGAPQTLATGWRTLNNPAIVFDAAASGSRLMVFDGGIQSGDPGDTHDGLNWWTSGDGGATWGLQPGVISGPGGTAYVSDTAAVLAGSTVFQSWSSSAGVFVHRGLENGPGENVNDVGEYGYDSSLGYDATGNRLYVVAAYNATGKPGLWAREIDQATGAGLGASFQLPKSTADYSGTESFSQKQIAVPVTGLTGQAGVVVAYPAGYPSSTELRVWVISGGTTSTRVLASSVDEKGATAVAADPEGRAWVVWTDNGGTVRRVYASRSNVGASAWGAVVSVAGPAGTSSLWQLAAAAQSGRLDVLGQFTAGDANRIYHTQLSAGLSVTVAPAKAKPGAGFTATVTVKDAGVAVAGATVTIAGKSASTGADGVARLKVKAGKAGRLVVTVQKAGYAKASAAITVKR
jgi:hypothetical protein